MGTVSWEQMTPESLLLLFIINLMKEMFIVHCNIPNCDVFFCIISAFTLSCWLNHWVSQTLTKLYTMVCSLLLPLAGVGGAEFSTGSQGQKSGTDWGRNKQRLQKIPVHVHMGALAFLFPQAQQRPTISISTKAEPLIWREEIIHGEGSTKDIYPCFVSEAVQFFFLQCQPSPWVLW